MSESAAAPAAAPGGRPTLKRAIGAKLLVFFVIGDILGTGIYALTGQVAGEVGGAAWMAFGLAFLVAIFTATSYAELVGKYPRAAGAALYTHRAFGLPFLTFLVAFTVMCSGLTSASTAAITFGSTERGGLQTGGSYLGQFVQLPLLIGALGFILILTLINFIGVSESVRLNVVLTCIEIIGLLIVIGSGIVGFDSGRADASMALQFHPGEVPLSLVISGAALSFFALVGFEDSVNMVEETKNPQRDFPRALFLGLTICGVVYMSVAFFATALVPVEVLGSETNTAPLLSIVDAGAPGFPLWLFAIIALCAVSNTALINLMMASRLVYGMAEERIVPTVFGRVHPLRRTPWVAIIFTVAIVTGLVLYGAASEEAIELLGSTTSLLLLAVFALVNIANLWLRRRPVEHAHFRAPTLLPVLAIICSIALVTPQLSGRDPEQYAVAGVLLLVGIVLWLINRATHGRTREFDAATLGKR